MGLFDFFKEKETRPKFQLSNLIEILQDGICISNLNGDIIYLNNSAYELLGVDKTQDINALNFFTNFVRSPESINMIKTLIHKEGLVKNLELSLRPLKNNSLDIILTVNSIVDFREQTIGFLFLFKDITEFKRIQQQLLQSQKLESVGLMASGIAHDFNNILAAIIPNAELIKLSVPRDSDNFKRAMIIEKSALRASDIARKLLTFTRDQEQQKRPVNLNSIIRESLELVENSFPRNIEIKLNLADELYMVLADPIQMQQVFMNLLINARDAMPQGGEIWLHTQNYISEVELHQEDISATHFVKFSITDTGTGISIENIPKIFDPFFTTKEVGKGTGLGLSMVYGIVKSHNGHIEVYSKEKRGTTFEILLPVDEKFIESRPEPVSQEDIPKGLTFLIVDDEEYVRDILADILKFLGNQVLKASSGKEALDVYSQKAKEIDYVIVDLRMPKMDGRSTFLALKKINPHLKAIFTSGFDDRYNEKETVTGVLGFLRKPYSIKSVSDSLGKFLENAKKEIFNG